MAKQTPSLYSLSKTFVWFTIVSLLLTGSLVAVVVMDYERGWKNWQKKFVLLKAQKTKEELKQAEQNIDKQKLDDLKKRYLEADSAVRAHHVDYKVTQRNIEWLDSKIAMAMSDYQNLKQKVVKF